MANSIHQTRIMLVSAPSSGQGKTSVTAALARRLIQAGERVRIFKAGPDFLDPAMLEKACGGAVHTLDLWMTGEEECRRRLADAAAVADTVLIEGVMGLYDGMPSSADLARCLGVPVLAVIDVAAMAQTAGAVAQGMRDYGPVNLAGAIANRVAGPGHASMVAAALRDIPLLASVPQQARSLPERHLGLAAPAETRDIDALLDAYGAGLLLDEAAWSQVRPVSLPSMPRPATAGMPLAGRVVAIARDAAFAFLYPANLECLRELGASIRFFSPLADEAVPADADALYLPGGYPELHACTLSRALRWRESVARAHRRKLPIYAECGGMMALAEVLVDADGQAWTMAGLMPGQVHMGNRLAAIGHEALHTPFGMLRGHAFHYSRVDTPLAPAACTVKHPAQTAGEAVYCIGTLTASYFHAYFPSCPPAVAQLFQAPRQAPRQTPRQPA